MLADHEPPAPQNSPERERPTPSPGVLRNYGPFLRWSDQIMLLLVASMYTKPYLMIAHHPVVNSSGYSLIIAELSTGGLLWVTYLGLRSNIRQYSLGRGRIILITLMLARWCTAGRVSDRPVNLPGQLFGLTLCTFSSLLIAWIALRYLHPVLKQEP